jgi:D-beta-D-heptose 7-phosphate kinase/D-beta-D-heptose 1-phosphate adenosyltransferase
MDVLSQFLNLANSRRLKIIVVGDSMVDEYYAVRVSRVSPEFPIPVLHSETDEAISTVPGGAANVCSQLKHWNTEVNIVTAWDDTSYSMLGENKIACNYVVSVQDWKVPRKKRFYDGDFPLDRWDVEMKVQKTNTFAWSAARSSLLQNFGRALKEVKPDIVILSDYGKGIFVAGAENISQPIIQLCNKYNVPTIVDPKTINCDFWRGCTVIKPNADWAKGFYEKYNREECKKSHHWNEESAFIKDQLNCDSVVLTDSGNGVCVYHEEESCFYPSPVLSKKRPVIRSVIGAGDCFCAFFAMSYALGVHLEGSVQVAFNGASAYIEDKHNNPVTPYQFWKWHNPIEAKKVTIDELIKIKKNTPNQTWVWTNGCFDIIHPGHLKTFTEAKKLGDKLVVGLNTDESVRMLKGETRPILSFEDRQEQLAHFQYVDFIVPISEKTPSSIIEAFKPDKIVKGGDYDKKDIAGIEVVGEDNIHLIPLMPGVSTSRIIEKVKNG